MCDRAMHLPYGRPFLQNLITSFHLILLPPSKIFKTIFLFLIEYMKKVRNTNCNYKATQMHREKPSA